MSKKQPAKKPAAKADKLKALKSKPVRQPKKKKTIDDHIAEAKGLKPTNGQPKKLTTDELAEKLKRDLVIRYVAVDSDNDFLILNADDNNKKLPKEIEKDTFKAPVH